MRLSLFDLHCDTAYEMHRQRQPLKENTLAVSLQKAAAFDRYVQVMAHWTEPSLSDEEGWQAFCAMLENLKNDPSVKHPSPNAPTLLLSVEDARILCGIPERVDELYSHGVRILTPLWKGETCIGGSHDTDLGLTEFGRKALSRAAELGMILDISHASEKASEEIFEISAKSERPVIASHSNAFALCPVSRNLRKWQIDKLLSCDGVIGINLHRYFLTEDGNATIDHILSHIEYFLENGAEDHLALGCDMDGCDLPTDIPDLSKLPLLAKALQKANYSEELINKIFYQNAYSFAQKYLCEEIDTSTSFL